MESPRPGEAGLQDPSETAQELLTERLATVANHRFLLKGLSLAGAHAWVVCVNQLKHGDAKGYSGGFKTWQRFDFCFSELKL